MASLAPAAPAGADIEWQRRHGPVTRITHWVRVVAMAVLLASGLQIFNAYPRLHWGAAGSSHDPAWLAIEGMADPARGRLVVGGVAVGTTGLLGVSRSEGAMVAQAFPGWLTLPATRDLATGRRYHFFFAWVLVLNGLLYLGVGLSSGGLQRKLLPTGAELAPAHLWREVLDHARFRFPRSEGARGYNSIQKLSYAAVVFLLLPLMVLTGLAMSPSVSATLPVAELFGGRQSARSLHFIAMTLLLLFVIVHVGLVLTTGFSNLMRSMITGRFAIRRGVW